MLKRQREGSVICTSCGVLVGVNDDTCYNCGRRNPGLWGYAPALRRLGQDLGFVPLVMGGTVTLYVLSLLLSRHGDAGIPVAQHRGPVPARRQRRAAGLRIRPLVDGAHRRVAARAGVLHVLFNVMWIRQLGAGRRRSLWRRPHGHHLHRGWGDGVCR